MTDEPQRPLDPDELHDFWEQQGMPWRIEPEISEDRVSTLSSAWQ
jgi:hypothetical protein